MEKKGAYRKVLDVVKVLKNYSMTIGKLGLLFEGNTLQGIIYRDEIGRCVFGESDGVVSFVDLNSFLKVNEYMDVLRSRKVVKEDCIELRHEDEVGKKYGKIDKMEESEVALSAWGEVDRLELEKSDIYSLGDSLDYFLLNDGFYFSSTNLIGRSLLSKTLDFRVKLSPAFVKIFELDFDVIMLAEEGTFLFGKEIEILLLSGIEGIEEAMDERFKREVEFIKTEQKFIVSRKESTALLLEEMYRLRSLGAELVELKIKDNNIELFSTMGVSLRRELNLENIQGQLEGCVLGPTIDALWKLKDKIEKIYVDDVMILFEGEKVSILSRLADKIR